MVFMSASACCAETPDFSRPIAPNQCTLRTICPACVSMRFCAAPGPEKVIGSHASMPVTRVKPLGPSMPGYGKTKSGGITPITSNAVLFSVSGLPMMFGSAPNLRRQ